MVLRSSEDERKVWRLVEELKMRLVQDEERPLTEGITRQVAWQLIPGLHFQYFEDSRTESKGVVLVGDDEASVAKYGSLIERFLQPLSLEELLAAISGASGEPERAWTVLRAGLGAPNEYDARFFDRVVEAMGSESLSVRVAAVLATTYSFWPQYREPLALVAEVEEDPDLREEASSLLEASLSGLGEQEGGDES
jgi:hypothetical protein